MKGKKWLSLLIVLSMVVSFLPLAAAATNYNDTQEHWAKAEIAKWSDLGILQGSGDLFRPSAPITRGEMAIILDRVMKYQEEALNAFSDLGQSWYTDAVLKANAAGIIKGDGNTVRPTDNITREEAAVMLGRALGLEEVSGNTSFGDNASISSWAKGYVSAMASKGFVGGVGANQFSPKANITRAEIVKLIDNAVKGFYTTASTHSGTVNGTAIVNADGATLKDMTINGDLIIAEGVGDGEVTLNNVKVTGQTIVRGGGENSVIVTGNSSLGKVIVDKKSDGTVSVKVTGNAKVDVVVAENGAINVSGTFSQLDIKGDVDVSLVNAKVDAVNVESKSIVVVDKASVVKTVAVAASSANVQVSGTVTTVTTTKEATNTKIETTSTAKITNVVAQAQGTTITGSGAITTVKAEANNVAVSTPNTKVEAGKGTTGVTAGGTTVSGGSSSTTNNSGTGSTTTPPSGGGGGGGGGSTEITFTLTFDGTAPVLGEVTFAKNAEGNYVLTVNATDEGSGLASLEVDHSLEGTLPEFTLGTVGESYDGEEFSDLKGTSYTFADGVWTVYFNAHATNEIIDKANGSITFYFSIKDVAGNQFGDMYNVTPEMTKTFDTTAPTVTSTVYKQADNELVITFSKPVLFYLDSNQSKVTDPAILLGSLYAVPINGGENYALNNGTSTSVAFGSDNNESLATGVTTITITNCAPIEIAEDQNFFLSVSNATVKSVVGIELDQAESISGLKFTVKGFMTAINAAADATQMKAALEASTLNLTEYNKLNDELKTKVAQGMVDGNSGPYDDQPAVQSALEVAVEAKQVAAEATTGLGDAIMYYDTLENALAAGQATLNVVEGSLNTIEVTTDLAASHNLTIPDRKTLILSAVQTGTGSLIVEAGGAFQTPKVNIVGAAAYFTPTGEGTIEISPIQSESGTKTKYVLNGAVTVNKHTPEGGITIMSGDELDLSAVTLTVNSAAGDAANPTFIIKSGGKLTTDAENSFYYFGGETAIPSSFTAAFDHTFTFAAETSKWIIDAAQYIVSDVEVVDGVTVTVSAETPDSLTLTLEGSLDSGDLTSNNYLASGANNFFAAFYDAEGTVAGGNRAGGQYVAVAFEQSKLLKAAGLASGATYHMVQANPMLQHFTNGINGVDTSAKNKTNQYTFTTEKFNNGSYLWFLLGDKETYSDQITFEIKSDNNGSAGETLYTITIVNNVTFTPAD